MPRLVRLGEYRTEAFMDGTLLVFTHKDIPGIIGYVGNVLAEEKVNIAQMAVGRAGAAGSSAIGVLNLDNTPTSAALERVIGHDSVEEARLIHLPPVGELPEWMS